MPALPPRASTVNSTSVAPSFEMPIAERALICAYQDLPLEYAPGPPGCNTPSGSYSGIVFTPPVTICAEPATAFHTSSGRYRFKDEAKANEACLPCHAKTVEDAPAHTHHKAGTAGNECISCHMPMTEFARMRRSDHSMRPPTPAT